MFQPQHQQQPAPPPPPPTAGDRNRDRSGNSLCAEVGGSANGKGSFDAGSSTDRAINGSCSVGLASSSSSGVVAVNHGSAAPANRGAELTNRSAESTNCGAAPTNYNATNLGATNLGANRTSNARPRKKTTSLWSYILPSAAAPATHADPNDAAVPTTIPVPAAGPSDRNALSVRLMLGDAKATLQHLSDRVDRVLHECREAKNVERVVADTVERAVAAVAEANVAHTSRLEETIARCASLEAALAVQTQTIVELGAKCEMNMVQTSNVLNRLGATHDIVMSLLPAIPLLQALPTEIQNSQLKTAGAVDRIVENVLRTSQNHLHESLRISEEHKAATQHWIASEQLQTRTELADIWRESTSSGADRLRREVARGLDALRESWTVALSLHRQEISSMVSAVLPALGSGAGPAGVRPNQVLVTPSSDAPCTIPGPSRHVDANTAAQDQPPSSSLAHSGFVAARSCEAEDTHVTEHAAKNSPLEHAPDKNSSTVHTARVLVADTQSTTPSSAPDQEDATNETAGPHQESIEPLESEDEDADALGHQTAGQTFAALDQHTRLAPHDFTTPDSPPFSIHRQPLTVKTGFSTATRSAQDAPKQLGTTFCDRFPEMRGLPRSGTFDTARAPTLGRSSPVDASIPNANLNKRSQRDDDAAQSQGLAKRPRKAKTRMIISSQELIDSSPER